MWRIMGTSTAKVDAVTTPTQRLQFTLTGGLDFFNQRNDILSPADLQFEPFDGQPGTVVLGKGQDTMSPVGPTVVPKQFLDGTRAAFSLWVNGSKKQSN